MTNHPYPKHIVDAVAKQMHERTWEYFDGDTIEWNDMTSGGKSGIIHEANLLLTALWDASRIDHPGQVESIPGDTILTTPDNRAVSAQTMQWVVRPADYPAHVIFWGDHDDR